MPETSVQQNRKKASYKRRRVFWSVSSVVSGFIAVGALIGVLVAVILMNFNKEDADLYYILTGAFAGGAILFALCAFGCSRLLERATLRETDYRELCDGEDSFFVGEGTLATFTDGALVIHSEEDGNRETVRVPYGEMRFFSVCTRIAPRERGKWRVVLEIPVKYLAKEGKAKKNDPPALVETDGKERLYRCLEKYGLELSGELPPRGEEPENTRFRAVKKFSLPNRTKRRRAIMLLGLGVVLAVAGVVVGFLWQISLGCILAFVGLFLAGRGAWAFLRAKAVFAVYREGVYYTDSARTERRFLKAAEIERFVREEKDGMPVLKVRCTYGDYRFPLVQGALEALGEIFPEKCG